MGVCASHSPAGFTWYAEATRHKSVWRQSRRCRACVYSSPTARGVSLRIQTASVAALYADRRIGVTKQRGDWHPSRPLQARRLTLYMSPDALNSSPRGTVLRDLPPKLVLSSDWNSVFRVPRSCFFSCWLGQNFQVGEMKEVQGIPFRGMYV